MNNILTKPIRNLSLFFLFTLTGFSCTYKEIAVADYPASKLYMPAAVNGFFIIDNFSLPTDSLPTPGQPYRFTVDLAKNKLMVPLSVYRGSVDLSGSQTISINTNTDTINTLIATSQIPATTQVLPAAKFVIPGSVEMANGSNIANFNLEIDLDYLRSLPGAIIGIDVAISSPKSAVNQALSNTILLIYPKFLKPVADFSSLADGGNSKLIQFTNTSTYAQNYSWDFGDGSSAVTINSPSHLYAATGTYTITLHASGVTGDLDKSTKTMIVTVI
jgi:hypothetical protein